MRVLLCNKYFFLNGGTEKYLFDIIRHLGASGHQPIPFSVRYAGSKPSDFDNYFLPPPGAYEQAHLENMKISRVNWLRLADRSIYSFEARRALSHLIEETGGVDAAYLLNICNYMSPSVIHTLRQHGIPIVMQIGDYHLLCPNYLFLRDGRTCTLCIQGRYQHGLRFRCVKKSLALSAVRVLSMFVHRWLRIYDLVDAFVVPCEFMRSRMIEGGFPPRKIHLIRYPVALPGHTPIRAEARKSYVLYFGRISNEKGIDTLVRAFQKVLPSTDSDLVLIGRSYDGEKDRLEKQVLPEWKNRIRFMDFLPPSDLGQWIAEALFCVVPSRWYDNAPLSVHESHAHGTPVLGANIGGIPEQIQDGITGRLFTADADDDLVAGLRWMLEDRERLVRMGANGQDFAIRHLSLEDHTRKLLDLFQKLASPEQGVEKL